jgi:hypothetical protein
LWGHGEDDSLMEAIMFLRKSFNKGKSLNRYNVIDQRLFKIVAFFTCQLPLTGISPAIQGAVRVNDIKQTT